MRCSFSLGILLGPRGTGKALWTRERFPEALVVDLLDPATHREMAARPERLRELVEGNHALYYWQARIRPEDLRALRAFGEDYPSSRRILLHRGKDRLLRDGILCLPCPEFLAQLTPCGLLPNSTRTDLTHQRSYRKFVKP